MVKSISLQEALNKLDYKKREYIKYKFPQVRFDKTIAPKTEEEFLRVVMLKTMNTFLRFEKTAEYKAIVTLILESEIGNDLYEIFQVVRKNALTGNDRDVKLYLQLQKEIAKYSKQASVIFSDFVEEEIEEDDGLELE